MNYLKSIIKWWKNKPPKKAVFNPEQPPTEEEEITISIIINLNQFITSQPSKKQPFSIQEITQFIELGTLKQQDQKRLQMTFLQGIPYFLRKRLWLQMTQIDALKQQYRGFHYDQQCVKYNQNQQSIKKDISRTFSNTQFFNNISNQQLLKRVLTAFSNFDSEIGYCQGMNYLAGGLLLLLDFATNQQQDLEFDVIQSQNDEVVFWILVFCFNKRNFRRNFLPGLPGVYQSVTQLNDKIHNNLPNLFQHFKSVDLNMLICFWHCYVCLSLTDVSRLLAARIFDLFLLKDRIVIHGLIIKALQVSEQKLLKMDTEDILQYVRNGLWKGVDQWIKDSTTKAKEIKN